MDVVESLFARWRAYGERDMASRVFRGPKRMINHGSTANSGELSVGWIMVRGQPEMAELLALDSHSYALFTVPPWWTHAVATIYNRRNRVPLKHIGAWSW